MFYDRRPPDTPGELNFAITQLLLNYLDGGMSYTAINEVIGVLECAKLELYRRVAAPYEDKKKEENGDVY
jgi:hypothetical protein